MKPLSPTSPLVPVKFPAPASAKRSSGQGSHWKTRLENSDAPALWNALHRMVSSHPLVRTTLSNSHSGCPSPHLSIHDLTQDLYVLLLQKGRFNHYLATGMSDAEIEREIFQIELTNLLIGNLRRSRPENYRIVRRVSQALDTDPSFRRFRRHRKQNPDQVERYGQAADAVFGLSDWSDDKRMLDCGKFEDQIANISIRRRNLRRTGCTGETQIIVSNQELVELMVEIFEAIDSPAPLRVLRQLALSKLPVFDPMLTSIDDEIGDERQGRNYNDSLASAEANPEEIKVRSEQEIEARATAIQFLDRLGDLTRSNSQRTERLWRVLWHCYFDADEPSQTEIAEIVGISDSSVSDYRRKIEQEMRSLRFSPEQMSSFAEELNEQLQWRLSLPEQIARRPELGEEIVWPRHHYHPAAFYPVATAA
jgi:hypothetical protein